MRQSAELAFRLPRAAHVKIALFDIAGRNVATLLDGEAPAGETRVSLDAGAVAPGLYFAKLAASGRQESERVLVLR